MAELVKTAFDNLSNIEEENAKAMHIENSNKPKHAINVITETQEAPRNPFTPDTTETHSGQTQADIETQAERVAQINLKNYPQLGFTSSFKQSRGTIRRGGRGSGETQEVEEKDILDQTFTSADSTDHQVFSP